MWKCVYILLFHSETSECDSADDVCAKHFFMMND